MVWVGCTAGTVVRFDELVSSHLVLCGAPLQNLIDYLKGLLGAGTPSPRVYTALDQPGGVGETLQVLVKEQGPAAARLAANIATTMRTIGPGDWIRVDRDMRSPWISAADVPKLMVWSPDDAVELLGLASFSASGRARQAALKAMVRLHHSRSVPYALIRLGDWVPQVAEVAVSLLRARMAAGDAAGLIVHHGLVERLDRVERTDLRWFQQEILAFLRTSGGRPSLEAALGSDKAGERLFAIRTLRSEFGDRPELVMRAAADPSPSVRRWLAGCVIRGEVDADRDTLRSLLSDPSTMVSRLIIRSLGDELRADFRNELIGLSFSDVRPVRRSARYAVERSGPFDFPAACRRTIETSAPAAISAGVVGCLAETGDAGDTGIFRRLLEHNSGMVRAEAVSGILRLGGTDAAAEVVGLLDDPSGRVRRAVITGLTAAPSHLWVDPARRILASGTPKGRFAALKALAERGGWDPLPDLLTAIASDDAHVRLLGWDMLGAWQKHFGIRGWIRPTPECRAKLVPLWRDVQTPEALPRWWGGLRNMVDEALGSGGDSR